MAALLDLGEQKRGRGYFRGAQDFKLKMAGFSVSSNTKGKEIFEFEDSSKEVDSSVGRTRLTRHLRY